MRLACLALLALMLTACGGGSGDDGPPTNDAGLIIGPPPSGVVYVVTVPNGSFPDDRLGEYGQVGADGFVRLREDVLVNPTFAARIVCHELGHAIGLSHLADPSCVMHVDGFTLTTPLCPEESGFAAGYAGPTLTVYVGLTPGLHDAASLGASRWNNVAGHTILAVQ